jgi:hypothetical protein
MSILDPTRLPPNLGPLDPSVLSELQTRTTTAEQAIAKLTTQLEQLNANFASHAHQYANPVSGMSNYESFLATPDNYKDLLVHYTVPNTPTEVQSTTETFVIPVPGPTPIEG